MIESLDRNKTDLTHRITALAIGHLHVFGCRPIETEVCVEGGWIADVASFCYPTMTELRLGKLLKRCVPPDFKGDYDRHSWFSRHYGTPLTVLVEVKTSMSDYYRDSKTKFSEKTRPPAHLNYIAAPKEILDKIPFNPIWGRITCSETGEKVLKADCPFHVMPQHPGTITDFIAQVAMRRDNRTRYAASRQFLKQYRLDAHKAKQRSQPSTLNP